MAEFLTELVVSLRPDSDKIYVLKHNLIYESDIVGRVVVPKGFQTNFASVPRVPIAFWFFGSRAHREAVLHDYFFCVDSNPSVTYSQANRVFLEAMKVRGKPFCVRWPMYFGVCVGGWPSFHKRKVKDKL